MSRKPKTITLTLREAKILLDGYQGYVGEMEGGPNRMEEEHRFADRIERKIKRAQEQRHEPKKPEQS